MPKTLVVFYSMQGHTRTVAHMISRKLGVPILELKPVKKYNIASSLTIGKKHINAKYTPALKPSGINPAEYDEIYLGTPVWWYTLSPPVRTFLEQNDLRGKSVCFFSTHAGANGTTFRDLEGISVGSHIRSAKDFYTGAGKIGNPEGLEKEVDSWLNLINC